jgi:hypothetical protein
MLYEKLWNGEDCINVFMNVIWLYVPLNAWWGFIMDSFGICEG